MFKPKYKLTSKILSNISQIERFYGQLEAVRTPLKLKLDIEKHNLIQSTYISNSVEGNPLTYPEVTNLLLGDRVPANRNEKEVRNYFDILKKLNDYAYQKLSVPQVLEIHRELLTGTDDKIAGQIRNKEIVVGKYKKIEGEVKLLIKHNPPFYKSEQIEDALKELFGWTNEEKEISAVIKSGIFHHQFVYLHPFEDGNGRISRLFTALILLSNGYLINKYFVLDDWYDIDRILYSDKLHTADGGDKTEWLEYFTDGLKYSLQSALSRYDTSFELMDFKNRPTPKEKEVLKVFETQKELTAPELALKLCVSRQQAHSLLASLINKGYLSKKGSTKSSYYFLLNDY
jgi:Fic family protein